MHDDVLLLWTLIQGTFSPATVLLLDMSSLNGNAQVSIKRAFPSRLSPRPSPVLHLAATNRTSDTIKDVTEGAKYHPRRWNRQTASTPGSSRHAAQAQAMGAGKWQEANIKILNDSKFQQTKKGETKEEEKKRVSSVDHATCLYGLLCKEVSQNEEWRKRNQKCVLVWRSSQQQVLRTAPMIEEKNGMGM
jgi:hypothetical protein